MRHALPLPLIWSVIVEFVKKSVFVAFSKVTGILAWHPADQVLVRTSIVLKIFWLTQQGRASKVKVLANFMTAVSQKTNKKNGGAKLTNYTVN